MTAPLIVHADWGSSPHKRWMCVARRDGLRYCVLEPEPVGDLATFWSRIGERAAGGPVVVGFDFPIGLPVAYARRTGITDFRSALRAFGSGAWCDFYRLAAHPAQIALRRPFYPARPGGTRHQHLLDGLGMTGMPDLLRRCERPTASRAAAAPLFWTLGGKQVGRAAIIGWRDLLAPAVADRSFALALWPFDGDLPDLQRRSRVIVAETYPAEACLHLGLRPPGRGWSKTSQSGRRAQADGLLDWARARGVALSRALRSSISEGFGPRKGADDAFDAVLGVMSMLEVALGHRPAGAPSDDTVRRIEGWMLGLHADR